MTFEDIYNAILADFNKKSTDTDFLDRAKREINRVSQWAAGKWRWDWLREMDTVAITSSTTTIDAPTRFLAARRIILIDSADETSKDLIEWNWAWEARDRGDPTVTERDEPCRYAFVSAADGTTGKRKQVMYVFPYPNASYTLRRIYQVYPAEMTATSDEPWIPDPWQSILIDYPTARLRRQMGFDPELVVEAKRDALQCIAEMKLYGSVMADEGAQVVREGP